MATPTVKLKPVWVIRATITSNDGRIARHLYADKEGRPRTYKDLAHAVRRADDLKESFDWVAGDVGFTVTWKPTQIWGTINQEVVV